MHDSVYRFPCSSSTSHPSCDSQYVVWECLAPQGYFQEAIRSVNFMFNLIVYGMYGLSVEREDGGL